MGRVHRRLKHLVFPTYELHPVNSGGAGVLLAGAVRVLARAGYRITLLCEFGDLELERARKLLPTELHEPGSVELVSLRSLDDGPAFTGSEFEINSHRFARALGRLHERQPIDYVEFPEYAGMGLATLQRHAAGFLPNTLVALRIHGSLELIDRAESLSVSGERKAMWNMERESMRLAGRLLTPSPSLGRLYVETYGLPSERLVVSAPPMEELLRGLESVSRLPDPGHFLFFGKLQEVKGCVQFAEAGSAALLDSNERDYRFTFIGRDVYCATHQRMTRQCVGRAIPGQFEDSFTFLSGIDRLALGHHTRRAGAAVVPSRFETFCLAAHELRAVGLPLIVPRIPAFVDWLNPSTGCLQYDGSTLGLKLALERFRGDAQLRLALEEAPAPTYPPFVDAYRQVLGAETLALNT